MARALKFAGWCLIVLGIIGGVALWRQANWRDYNRAKAVYAQLQDNPYSRAEYETQLRIVTVWAGAAGAIGMSGVLSGILFLGLSDGLTMLGEIKGELRSQSKILNR